VEVKPWQGGGGNALLVRAQEGDADAFRALVEVHWAELHAHCYRMLASYHDAEDALQDALLRAWQALPGFERRSSLRAWLAVLSLRGERIAEVDYFLTAELMGRWGDDSSIDGAEMFARFGLPATIP
jgi:hypothetical protein